MELIKKLKDRSPEYPVIYENFITRFTLTQGGRAGSAVDSNAWSQGKYFTTKYEIFIYAALIGIRNQYRLPIPNDIVKQKFNEIKYWQPQNLVDYLIMTLLCVSDINFNELELMCDADVEKNITELKKLLEEYANGGFDKIKSIYDKDPNYFENNENCFLDLLDNG